ncbi:D-alanyl-D-alanine carboxypeptidase family protein [Stagnimonas aquatica]|uniref:D-alanyl-D-alanine carboxypeptidase family protein n=1 Tax=Stagnimonas aquatica TaxID=2689987 RepID=A0A3N0VKD9_9GAMM|nr:M15 family metallopeptidase [Stagnimonas aquatica]ROH93237.1 D-alanyl-D-alanine carboxypeptidase family protein [Stagnimonas aquatica]
MNRRQAGTAYRERIAALLAELGLPASLFADRPLRLIAEARRLTPVGLGTDGRDKLLTPGAARAWRSLRAAAAGDGVELLLISGFRSVDYQAALIRAKLARGLSAEEVLRINAPPGYSEHHSGRAVDIGCTGTAALDEAFETTPAYDWLRRHAAEHGFRMSYPRGNRQGYLYEPWHWFHVGSTAANKPAM